MKLGVNKVNGNPILIVDDDPAIRDLLSQMLEIGGFKVVTATDGIEGLEMFSIHKPSLVITDVVMPNMGGQEMCALIRQVSNVPIVMLSGQIDFGDQEQKQRLLNLRINAFMSKPIHMKEFLDHIFEIIDRAEKVTVGTDQSR